MAKKTDDAMVAAYQQEQTEPKEVGQSCPFKGPLCLYPLRYAMVEQPIEKHPAIKPNVNTTVKPIGLRLARKGFLYYVHSKYPNRVRAQIITEEGKFAGRPYLKFPRKGTLWVVYSEIEWTKKKKKYIADNVEGMRNRFMQMINLESCTADKGSPHLLPYKHGTGLIAECEPGEINDPLEAPAKKAAQTRKRPRDTSNWFEFETDPFYWSMNKVELPGGHHLSKFSGSPPNESAFILLHDVLGVLKDLTNFHGYLSEWQETWRMDNQQKFFAADFIESLYTYDFKEAKSYIEQSSKSNQSLSKDEYKILEERKQKQDEIEEINKEIHNSIPTISHDPEEVRRGREEYYRELAKKQEQIDQLKREISKLEGQIKNIQGDNAEGTIDSFDDYVKGKDDLFSDYGGLAPRVKNSTRFQEMSTFMKENRAMLQRHDELIELIVADRTEHIPNFYEVAWYFDSEDPYQYIDYTECLYACINFICETQKGTEFAHDYFIKQFGPQTMLTLMPTADVDWVKVHNEVRKMLGLYKSIAGALTPFQDADKLSDLLKLKDFDSPLVQRIKNLPQTDQLARSVLIPAYNLEMQQQLAGELDKLKGESKTQLKSFENQFIKLMKKSNRGMHSFFFESWAKDGIDFKLASEADIQRLDTLLKQASTNHQQVKNLIKSSKALKNRQQTMTNQIDIDSIRHKRAVLREKINQSRAQQKTVVSQLSDMTDGISKPGAGAASVTLIHPDLEELRSNYNNAKQGLWQGYGHAETEIEVKKLIRPGFSLALNLLIMNVINSYFVISKLMDKPERSAMDEVLLFGTISGLAGGINSYISEVWRKGLKDSLEKSQNPLMANKLGKVTLLSGFAGGIFTFLSSLAYTIYEFENFTKASEQGNTGAKFASIAKIGGNVWSVYLSGRQMQVTGHAVIQVIMERNVSWRMALASRATVLARLNLWMIVATAIVIIGGLAYEMLNPSKLILWVKHSIWGIDNRSWDFPTTQQKLAEVVLRPRLEVKAGIQHISQATGQFSYKTTQTYLKHSLSCFGITPSRFAQVLQIHQYHPLALCIIVLVDGKWINKTDEILETADFTVLEQGLRIDYDWPTYLVKKISRTEWTIAVTPDIAVEPLDKAYQFIRYSTQGTTVTEMAENDRLTTQGQYPLIAISDDYITMGQTND